MANWRRITGIAGLAMGAAVAAGAGAIIAAERVAIGRVRLQPDPEADEPLGQLRGRALIVLADDGVPLHAEIDGPDDAPVTIIFCHGYALSQEVWHYQRRDLAPAGRLVFWDQRGHGKSGQSSPEHARISQLGADLYAVLMATAPGQTPVVLVGHSMGAMTIMALARQHPELFGTKVRGAVLISTAAWAIDSTAWAPAPLRPIVRHAAPPVLRGVSKGGPAALVERGRQAAGDLAFLGTRRIAFGDSAVSPSVVDFLERLIRATPMGVVADFYAALLDHDERAALGVLGRVPVTVVTGERDRLVPPDQSDELAAEIRGSELVRVPGAGHAVLLERPDVVNDAITRLLARSVADTAPPGRSAWPGREGGDMREGTALVLAQIQVPTAARMRELGRRLAGLLRAGDLLVLTGPLGAGKTTLVQGIGQGLDVRGPVTSPTFVIARLHPATGAGPALVHADAYRLGSRAEVDDLDLDADLDRSVTVVEWGEGLVEDLAPSHLEIKIAMAGPATAPDEPDEPRTVRLIGRGQRWEAAAESASLALTGDPEALSGDPEAL